MILPLNFQGVHVYRYITHSADPLYIYDVHALSHLHFGQVLVEPRYGYIGTVSRFPATVNYRKRPGSTWNSIQLGLINLKIHSSLL